jgi:hypothetical protein
MHQNFNDRFNYCVGKITGNNFYQFDCPGANIPNIFISPPSPEIFGLSAVLFYVPAPTAEFSGKLLLVGKIIYDRNNNVHSGEYSTPNENTTMTEKTILPEVQGDNATYKIICCRCGKYNDSCKSYFFSFNKNLLTEVRSPMPQIITYCWKI